MTLFRKSKSKGDLQQEFQTTVRFLDDSEPIQLSFTKDTQGQYVLDKVCDTLNLLEKDYFGLRFVDAEKQRHWLDPLKTVYKQLKGVSPCVLCFRVKFYPADAMKLHEEITRYYLFLQLRRDLHHGRLLCSPQDANLLAAYIIQSELGDYDPQDHPPGYVAEFKMLPNQNVQQEHQIQDLHKTLTGQVPAEAEANFLKKASSLDTYGVDPHKVKDQKGNQMYLGVTHQGIMTFFGSRRTQIYKWSQIKKLAFEGKTFIAHVSVNENPELLSPDNELDEWKSGDIINEVGKFAIASSRIIKEDGEQSHSKKKHQPIGYKCPAVAACKYLWKCAVEQQLFFTLSNSFHAPKVRSGGSLFSRGSKFRFSGRCQNEAYIASEDIKRKEPEFQRTCSLPNFTRSDARVHVRNSANLSQSITEAGTLPAMSATSTPTIAVEPPPPAFEQRRNSREDRERRRNSRGSRGEKRKSREIESNKDANKDSPHTKDEDKENKINKDIKNDSDKEIKIGKETKAEIEIENKDIPVLANEPFSRQDRKPRLREIARQRSNEVIEVIEVQQRRTMLDEQPVTETRMEIKSVLKPVEVVAPLSGDVKPEESPVDVPGAVTSNATQRRAPLADTEDTIITEEITPEVSNRVESAIDSSKQNGGIPIIVTPATEPTFEKFNEPDGTIEEDEEEEAAVIGSLEDQIIELDREMERMKERENEPVVEMEVKPEDATKAQTLPNDVKTNNDTATPLKAKKRGGCSCVKMLAFTFFFVALTLTVTICVVMFSNVDHPVMNNMRAHLTFLEPSRDFILDKYNKVFHKS